MYCDIIPLEVIYDLVYPLAQLQKVLRQATSLHKV